MAMFQAKCPHCLTERAAFTVVRGARNSNQPTRWGLLAQCGVCAECALVLVDMDSQDRDPETLGGNLLAHGALVGYELHPALPPPDVPAHLPPNVAEAFLQGELLRVQKRMEEPAAAAYRRALDLALGAVCTTKSTRKLNLVARINALHRAGRLTDAIRDWSHEVRFVGNEIHGDERIERVAVNDMRDFTYFVLVYLFTLPKQVEMARERRGAASGERPGT